MKILALDQSINATGWSIWNSRGLKSYGLIESEDKRKGSTDSHINKICEMYVEVKQLIKKNKIEVVCIEGVQFQCNQAVYSKLSQLQGTIFVAAYDSDAKIMIVEPNKWKSHFGLVIHKVKRDEQKRQCIEIVKERFNLDVQADIADAIGIGHWCFTNLKHKGEKG